MTRLKVISFSVFSLIAISAVLIFSVRNAVWYRYSVSPGSIMVGDPIRLKFCVFYNDNIKVNMPDIKNSVSGFDLIRNESSRMDFFMFTGRKVIYTLTKYSPGEYTIPKIKSAYSVDGGNEWKDVVLPEKHIDVKTVLPEGFNSGSAKISLGGSLVRQKTSPFAESGVSEGAYKLTKGPIRFRILENEKIRYPVDKKGLAVKISIFLSVGIIALFFIFLVQKLKKKLSQRELPPLERALASLARIESGEEEKTGGVKEYCTKIHDIMLDLLRGHFGVDSKEMVLDEIRDKILDLDQVGYEEKKYIMDILEECEDIKYSPDVPRVLPEKIIPERVVDFVKKLSNQSEDDDGGMKG